MEVINLTLGREEQVVVEGKEFPRVFELKSESSLEDCCAWIKENKENLEKQLYEHGALVFRNFPTKEIPKFHDFLISFGWNHYLKYTGKKKTIAQLFRTFIY